MCRGLSADILTNKPSLTSDRSTTTTKKCKRLQWADKFFGSGGAKSTFASLTILIGIDDQILRMS